MDIWMFILLLGHGSETEVHTGLHNLGAIKAWYIHSTRKNGGCSQHNVFLLATTPGSQVFRHYTCTGESARLGNIFFNSFPPYTRASRCLR